MISIRIICGDEVYVKDFLAGWKKRRMNSEEAPGPEAPADERI